MGEFVLSFMSSSTQLIYSGERRHLSLSVSGAPPTPPSFEIHISVIDLTCRLTFQTMSGQTKSSEKIRCVQPPLPDRGNALTLPCKDSFTSLFASTRNMLERCMVLLFSLLSSVVQKRLGRDYYCHLSCYHRGDVLDLDLSIPFHSVPFHQYNNFHQM